MNLNLSVNADELSRMCVTYGVRRLELFGSAARREGRSEDSDLDFLVNFAEQHPLGAFERYFGLKESLERLFDRPVDLVEAKAIKNPYFQQAIDQTRILIYTT